MCVHVIDVVEGYSQSQIRVGSTRQEGAEALTNVIVSFGINEPFSEVSLADEYIFSSGTEDGSSRHKEGRLKELHNE